MKIRIFFIFTLFLIFHFQISLAGNHPLRIWVMPNEPGGDRKNITKSEVISLINKFRDEHEIIIENDPHEFLMPSQLDVKQPLAQYTVVQNQLLEELKQFQSSRKDRTEIFVEFLQWNNAFNRLSSATNDGEIDKFPDIVQLGSTWISSFATQKAIEDLSGHINEVDFFEPSITAAKPHELKGLYAAPWFVDTRVIYYHKGIIKDPEKIFKDWDSFLKNSPQILKKNSDLISILPIPSGFTWNLLHDLVPWLWANGGDILEPRSFSSVPIHSIKLDSEKSLQAIDYLSDLSKEGVLTFPGINIETLEGDFLKKKYAAILTGPWFVPRLGKNWENKIGITMSPAGKNGSHPFVGGSHLAVWRWTKKRGNFENAIELIKFLTSAPSQIRYSKATGLLPAIKKQPEMKTFLLALTEGRSYPPIAQWGTIVENELIRDHIWQIWQDISHRKPREIVHRSVKEAANALRIKLIKSAAGKGASYIGMIFIGTLGIGSTILIRTKRKFRAIQDEFSQKSIELEGLLGERKVLLATKAALINQQKENSEESRRLQTKIDEQFARERKLRDELEMLRFKQSKQSKELLEKVYVQWNGEILLDNKKIIFENNNQAKALIDYIIREAIAGNTAIQAICGYTLFGWTANELKSPPNYLFKVVVSKINSALKKNCLPAILVREKRNSLRWRLAWDREKLIDRSAAGEAYKMLKKCEPGNDLSVIFRVVERDPKCFEAYGLIPRTKEFSKELSFSIGICSAEIKKWKNGIEQAQAYSNSFGVEKEEMMPEIEGYKHKIEYMETSYLQIVRPELGESKPLHLKKIEDILEETYSQMASAKSKGIDDAIIWSQVLQSQGFSNLIASPKLSFMINNTYNSTNQTKEDPNLIQLALLRAYSEKKNISQLKDIKNETAFFKEIDRQVKNELFSLEKELSLLPEY